MTLAVTCISVLSESSAKRSSMMFMYTGMPGNSGGISSVVLGSIVKSPPTTADNNVTNELCLIQFLGNCQKNGKN